MRSTGEVMGIDRSFGLAFAKSQSGGGQPAARARDDLPLPRRPRQAGRAPWPRAGFVELGFSLVATAGTAAALRGRRAFRSDAIVGQGRRGRSGVDAVDLISSGKVDLVVNTPRAGAPAPTAPTSAGPRSATASPCVTTVAAALAAAPGSAGGRSASPTCGRCRSTTATASSGSRCDRRASVDGRAARRSTCASQLGPLELAEPDRRRVGNVRPRRRGRARYATPPARRGHHEVAAPLRVARQPGTAAAGDGGGMLNAVGLHGPGRRALGRPRPAGAARALGAVSSRRCGAASVDEYGRGAAAGRAGDELVAVEVNVSCPNLEDRAAHVRPRPRRDGRRDGAVVEPLGGRCRSSPSCRRTSPISARSPRRGRRGRDGLTLVNTVMGLVVDAERARAASGAGGGGLSGPPIKPVALAAVCEVAPRRSPRCRSSGPAA